MGQKQSTKSYYEPIHYPETLAVQYPITHSFFVPIFGSPKDVLLFFRQSTFLTTSSPLFGYFILTPESQPISKRMNNTEILQFINTSFTYEERTKYSDLTLPYTSNASKLVPLFFLGENVQLDPIEFNSMFLQQQQQQTLTNNSMNNNTLTSHTTNNNQSLPTINYVKYFLPYPQPANSEDGIYPLPPKDIVRSGTQTIRHPTYQKILPFHGFTSNSQPLQSTTANLYTLPPPRLIQIIPFDGYPLQRLLTLDLNDSTQIPFHHGATIIIIDVIDEESVHSFYNFITQTQQLLSFDCLIDILSVTVHIIIYNTESIDSSLISIPEITTLCATIGFDSNNIHFHYLDITTDIHPLEHPIQHYTKQTSLPDVNASLGFFRTVLNAPPLENSKFPFKQYFQFDKQIGSPGNEIIENSIHSVIWKDIWHKFFDLEHELHSKKSISNQSLLNPQSITTTSSTSTISTSTSIVNSLSSTTLYQSIQSNPLLQFYLNHFMRIQTSLDDIPLDLFHQIISPTSNFDIKSFPQLEQYFTQTTGLNFQLFECMIQSYQLLQQQPSKSYSDINYLHNPHRFKLLSNPLPTGLPKSYYTKPNPLYPPLPPSYQYLSHQKRMKPIIFSPTTSDYTIPNQFQFDSFIRINNWVLCENDHFIQFAKDSQLLSPMTINNNIQPSEQLELEQLLYKKYLKHLHFKAAQMLPSLFGFKYKQETFGVTKYMEFVPDGVNRGVFNSIPLSPHYSMRTNTYFYTPTSGTISNIDDMDNNDDGGINNDDQQDDAQNNDNSSSMDINNTNIKIHSTITYQTRFETPLISNPPESDIKSTLDPITFYPLRYLYGVCILPYVFHRKLIPNRMDDQTEMSVEINIESNNDNNDNQPETIANPFGYDITLPPFRNTTPPITSTTTTTSNDQQPTTPSQPKTFGEQFSNLNLFHFNHDAIDWKLYQLSCPVHIVMVCLNPVVNDDDLKNELISSLLTHKQKIKKSQEHNENLFINQLNATDDTVHSPSEPKITDPELYFQPISKTELNYLQSILPIQMKNRFINDVYPFAIQSQGQLNRFQSITNDDKNDIPTIRDKINDLWTFSLITPLDWEQYFYQAEFNATQRRITLINDLIKFQSSQ